ESPLIAELHQVRLEREARGLAQQRMDAEVGVGPGAVEHLVERPRSGLDRLEDAPLSIQAVLEVLVDAGVRIPDERTVTGTDHLQVELPETAKRVQVERHRAPARADEHAPRAEDRVAGEAR